MELKINRPYLDNPNKIRSIEFMGLTNIRIKYFNIKHFSVLTPYFDPFKIRTFWRTTFKLYSICCICGYTENIESHHVKSIKDLLSNKQKQSFKLIMQQINRKQIPVCYPCHTCITNGKYDQKKLTDLFSESLARL